MNLVRLTILIAISFVGCQSKAVIENFDSMAWQSDPNGCAEVRLEQVENLVLQKDNLKGLGQEDIKQILGKPDEHELYSRNKKSFTYFISPGKDCDPPSENEIKLIIRFDGLGRAKEIVYYN